MQFLRRFLRYAKSLLLLNSTRDQVALIGDKVSNLQASFRELFDFIHRLNAEFQNTKDLLAAQSNALTAHSDAIARQSEVSAEQLRSFDHKVTSIAAGFDMLSRSASPPVLQAELVKPSPPPQLSLLLDTFYVALESKFRGDVTDIGQRQTVYLPDIEQALSNLDNKTVLDLGCGRGEWLSLLRKHGIEGLGVDTNEGQLAAARENGLAVYNEDGLQFLRTQSEGRFAAVTAFHIFEHLPFAVLAEWLLEIRRVLCPGGILIAETPNPENLIVGANTFHLDPTHTRPLPSGVLAILSETVGLAVKQIRPLHPHGDLAAALKDLPERTAYLLYGYQDYGLIVERPLKGTV
jgi:SAM-dependent methyltransferase